MEESQFNQTIEAAVDRSLELLAKKNAGYSEGSVDKLAGMKHVAEISGTTVLNAIKGMMAKHTSSIYTMLSSDKVYPIDVWQEKITDHINYLLFVEAAVIETQTHINVDDNADIDKDDPSVEGAFAVWFRRQPEFDDAIFAARSNNLARADMIEAVARTRFMTELNDKLPSNTKPTPEKSRFEPIFALWFREQPEFDDYIRAGQAHNYAKTNEIDAAARVRFAALQEEAK